MIPYIIYMLYTYTYIQSVKIVEVKMLTSQKVKVHKLAYETLKSS